MTHDERCPACNMRSEIVEHVFRNCSRADAVWRSLMPVTTVGWRRNIAYEHWLKANLNNQVNTGLVTTDATIL